VESKSNLKFSGTGQSRLKELQGVSSTYIVFRKALKRLVTSEPCLVKWSCCVCHYSCSCL